MANPLGKVSYGDERIFQLGAHAISLRHRLQGEDETSRDAYGEVQENLNFSLDCFGAFAMLRALSGKKEGTEKLQPVKMV